MSHKNRQAAKVDANQSAIVEELRRRGVSVEPEHDDIIVGYMGHTFWFEIKNPETCFMADGVRFKKGEIKKSQLEIMRTWRGHYSIVTSIEEILYQIGYNVFR